MEVNGKFYPLWGQIVEKKEQFIGGILEEGESKTTILDIRLKPNGETSAYIEILGSDFDCGFDVTYGGISGGGEPDWLTFTTFAGYTFRIKGREVEAV